jgi:hypothetical protein
VLLDEAGDPVTVEITSVPLHRGARVIGVFGQALDVPTQPHVPRPSGSDAPAGRGLEAAREGRSTRQSAQELHVSPDTVRNHVRDVLRALGAHSRLEAVALARREQLGPG